MDRAITITLIIVIGFVLIAGMGYSLFNRVVPAGNTVTGNGQSQIEAVPDLVKVYFNVQTEGDTSEEAKDAAAEIVEEMTVSLVMEGFDRDEIQTTNFNIYPKYKYNTKTRESEIEGYQVTHQIVVEISTDDTDRIGKAIDAGADAGAGISYINFELSQDKQNNLKAKAIEMAAQDARIKAEALAKGLDRDLGKLVSVSDGNWGYDPWRVYSASGGAGDMAFAEAKAATTDIQPSDQTISANVRVVYQLK